MIKVKKFLRDKFAHMYNPNTIAFSLLVVTGYVQR